jgi:hypothetical protein
MARKPAPRVVQTWQFDGDPDAPSRPAQDPHGGLAGPFGDHTTVTVHPADVLVGELRQAWELERLARAKLDDPATSPELIAVSLDDLLLAERIQQRVGEQLRGIYDKAWQYAKQDAAGDAGNAVRGEAYLEEFRIALAAVLKAGTKPTFTTLEQHWPTDRELSKSNVDRLLHDWRKAAGRPPVD